MTWMINRVEKLALETPLSIVAFTYEIDVLAAIPAERKRITCPLLALWSKSGGLAKWYEDAAAHSVWLECEPRSGGDDRRFLDWHSAQLTSDG